MSKTLVEYIEEKEINEEILEEDFAKLIGTTLGFTSAGIIFAWVISLILLAMSKGGSAVINNIRRAGNNIGIDKEKLYNIKTNIIKKKNSPIVKNQIIKTKENINRFEVPLKDVFEAIKDDNFKLAREEYKKLPAEYKSMTAINNAIIGAVVKQTGEVPISIQSRGNSSFNAIKTIINIRVAKVASEASKTALKNLSEKDDDNKTSN
ncbi:MAG: hypothetical protein LBF97_00500 [Elusimicrobiota bacterium]|jgi:hypothetical protein|nr:hypothetical protein [Elusimicrobiota bacterium]